jgi:hypothetical protein
MDNVNLINNSELSSKLNLNISKGDIDLPYKSPNNYQFYFDNIQVVGNDNFEEDYYKIFKVDRRGNNSINHTPQTSSSSSTNKTIKSNVKYNNLNNNYKEKNCVIENNFVKQNKNKLENDDIINQEDNNIDIDKEYTCKNLKKKELNEEKMQSSCCLLF